MMIPTLEGKTVVASISGGKDSAAMSLHLRERGIEHRRVFMDTGWESEVTYEYLRGELTRVLGPIEEIMAPRTMEELCFKKGMFPSRLRRFCTEELKVKPMIRYINALIDAGHECINTVGIRRAESKARSQLEGWEWSDAFDSWVWRPLIIWSEQDVIDIHARHGLMPNPLYLKGASRVGCWPCIFSRKSEIAFIAKTDPCRIDRLRVLEERVGDAAEARASAKGQTLEDRGHHRPAWFQSNQRSSDGVYHCMPIDEAVKWANTAHGGRQVDMFAAGVGDEGCMRWGLCDHGNGDDK